MSTDTETLAPGADLVLHHHSQPETARHLAAQQWSRAEEIALPIVEQGAVVYPGGPEALHDLDAARARRHADVEALDPGVRRLVNPHVYHVSITPEIHRLKHDLLAAFDE
jgi:nicotinate phosphoribosyltransferase